MESDQRQYDKKILVQMLSALEAEDVLTPISMTQLINIESTYEEIIEMIRQDPHECYPVYQDGIDNILGILYIRDLLIHQNIPFDLHQILQHPLFISENKNIVDLFEELTQKKQHIAMVVDEHGSVRGVVTPNDILQELVEVNESEETIQSFIVEKNSQYYVDARLPIEEFNKKFNIECICENCDSVGGFLIEQFGYVPQVEENFTIENIKITVTKMEGAKLQELMIVIKK